MTQPSLRTGRRMRNRASLLHGNMPAGPDTVCQPVLDGCASPAVLSEHRSAVLSRGPAARPRGSEDPRCALDDIEVGVRAVWRLTDRPAPAGTPVGPAGRPAAGHGWAQTLNRKRFNVIRRAIRLNRMRLHLCGPARGTVVQQSGAIRSNAAPAAPNRRQTRPDPRLADPHARRGTSDGADRGAPPPVRPTRPHVRNTGLALLGVVSARRMAPDGRASPRASARTGRPADDPPRPCRGRLRSPPAALAVERDFRRDVRAPSRTTTRRPMACGADR